MLDVTPMALFRGNKAAASTGNDILLGRFKFRVVYRVAGDDQGLTIHVFGPRLGSAEEVLRFDCFRDQPHYHLGWSYRDERFTEIQDSAPFDWAVRQIRSNMNALLDSAEADSMNDSEVAGLLDAADLIQHLGETIERDV